MKKKLLNIKFEIRNKILNNRFNDLYIIFFFNYVRFLDTIYPANEISIEMCYWNVKDYTWVNSNEAARPANIAEYSREACGPCANQIASSTNGRSQCGSLREIIAQRLTTVRYVCEYSAWTQLFVGILCQQTKLSTNYLCRYSFIIM